MFRSVIASEAKQSYTIVIASEAKESYTIVIASEAKQSGLGRQILTCLRLLRSAALCAAPLALTRL